MKCKNCNLCRGFWSFGGVTSWGWKCRALNEVIFHIEDDEVKLLDLPSFPMFESWRKHWKPEVIEIWRDILDIDCIATDVDIINFMDWQQECLRDVDVKLKALLDDKEDLQRDIYDASITIEELTQK